MTKRMEKGCFCAEAVWCKCAEMQSVCVQIVCDASDMLLACEMRMCLMFQGSLHRGRVDDVLDVLKRKNILKPTKH